MEQDLDTIADGKTTYLKVMEGFYRPLTAALKTARLEPGEGSTDAEKKRRVSKAIAQKGEKRSKKGVGANLSGKAVTCDKCGSAMELREGKYGPYYACLGFPKCSNLIPAAQLEASKSKGQNNTPQKAGANASNETGEVCDKCGSPMLRRTGKNGDFFGCSSYPTCRNTKPIPLDVACPQCKQGKLVQRVGGRYKSTFYGCSRYPDCRYTTNENPESSS